MSVSVRFGDGARGRVRSCGELWVFNGAQLSLSSMPDITHDVFESQESCDLCVCGQPGESSESTDELGMLMATARSCRVD